MAIPDPDPLVSVSVPVVTDSASQSIASGPDSPAHPCEDNPLTSRAGHAEDRGLEIAAPVLGPFGLGMDLSPLIGAVGFGYGDFYILMFSHFCWVSVGLLLTFYTFLTPAFHCTFGTSLTVASIPATIAFFGLFVGSVFWAVLMDRYGRLRVMNAAVVTLLLGTVFSAVSPSFWLLCVFQFFVGFGAGAPFNLSSTYLLEHCPTDVRGFYGLSMNIGWGVGSMLSVAIPWLVLNRYGWRVMLLIGLAPSCLLLLFALALHDTPHFYLVSGKHSETLRVLCWIAYLNGTLEKLHGALCTQVFENVEAGLERSVPPAPSEESVPLAIGGVGQSIGSVQVRRGKMWRAGMPGHHSVPGHRTMAELRQRETEPWSPPGSSAVEARAKRCRGLRLWSESPVRVSLRDVADRLIVLGAYCRLTDCVRSDERSRVLREKLMGPVRECAAPHWIRGMLGRMGAELPRWAQALLPGTVPLTVCGDDPRLWGLACIEASDAETESPVSLMNTPSVSVSLSSLREPDAAGDHDVEDEEAERSQGPGGGGAEEPEEAGGVGTGLDESAKLPLDTHAPPLFAVASTGADDRGRLKDLFSPSLRRTTLLLGAIWFFVFLAQLAFTFSVPELVAVGAVSCPLAFPTSTYLSVFLSLSAIVPFTVVALFLVDRPKVGRRYTCVIFAGLGTVLVGAITVLLLAGAQASQPVTLVFFVILAAVALGASNVVTSVIILYSTEVYPTVLRAVGVGYLGVYNGIGATVAPFVLGVFLEFVGVSYFNLVVTVLFGATTVILLLLPHEPCGKHLVELTDDKIAAAVPEVHPRGILSVSSMLVLPGAPAVT